MQPKYTASHLQESGVRKKVWAVSLCVASPLAAWGVPPSKNRLRTITTAARHVYRR
jgi:hypothetical protein